VPGPADDSRAPEPAPTVDPIPIRARFERQATGSTWEPLEWRLVAVEPGEPGDPLELRLFRDEAQGYYLNLTSGEPSIFVHWRLESGKPEPIAATLSYDEAARTMDGGETVDRVGMPEEMIAWLAQYVALHYRPESTRKRRGAKPSFMAREEFASMAARESARAGPPADEDSK